MFHKLDIVRNSDQLFHILLHSCMQEFPLLQSCASSCLIESNLDLKETIVVLCVMSTSEWSLEQMNGIVCWYEPMYLVSADSALHNHASHFEEEKKTYVKDSVHSLYPKTNIVCVASFESLMSPIPVLLVVRHSCYTNNFSSFILNFVQLSLVHYTEIIINHMSIFNL